jgi:hypothetical protein
VIDRAKITNDSTHPHIDFLHYPHVLLNTALKTRFGYTPQKTSAQALEALISARETLRPIRKPLKPGIGR